MSIDKRFLYCLVLLASPLAQGSVINGDFSTGLAGWTTADLDSGFVETSPSASVAVVGGVAELDTQGIVSNIVLVSLYQSIAIDPLATTLGFDIGFEQGDRDSGGTGAPFPDFFQVSYLDDLDFSFDRFFIGVDVNGFYDPNTFAPVTLPDLGNGLFRFETGISDLAGRSGTLYFDLNDLDDGFLSTGRVDNVGIGMAAVPEPGTLLLLGIGLAGMWSGRSRRPKVYGIAGYVNLSDGLDSWTNLGDISMSVSPKATVTDDAASTGSSATYQSRMRVPLPTHPTNTRQPLPTSGWG